MSKLIAALPESESASATVLAARPTSNAHGVDVTTLRQGAGKSMHRALLCLVDATAVADTIAAPTGGAAGPELWTYRVNKAGASRWYLLGSALAAGASIVMVANGGYAFQIDAVLVGERLCLAGTGAQANTYRFQACEEMASLG